AEAGWVDRITRRDEGAGYLSLARTWQMVDGYTEATDAGNPYGASVAPGTDIMDVASLGAQYTRLLDRDFELGVNTAASWAFGVQSGLQASIAGNNLAGSQSDFFYYEVGGRVGYRAWSNLTIDVYVNGVLAPHAIGSHVHEGLGFRWTL